VQAVVVYFKALSQYIPGGTEKTTTNIRIAALQTENQTRNALNKKQEC
jgi:hypothetical protein